MRSNFAILTLVLAATMAVAQMRPQYQPPQPGPTPQPQSGPSNQPPSSPPAASSSNQQSPSSSSAPSGHRLLQAKTQDELKAYQDAMAKTDPAQMDSAASAFAAKFPTSELKAALYIRAMNLYGQQNNAEKVIELGRKAITADPANPVSLVQVGSTLVESTRDTDMDRDQRLAEATKDAQSAVDNVDQLMVPPNATPGQVAAVKASILTMGHDTLGMADLNKGDPAGAEQEFLKAVDASKAQPEAVVFLRLSVAQDKLKKYPEALDSANKAVQLAPAGSAAQNLAKQQQERMQKLVASGGPATPSSIAPGTSDSATPAAQPPAQAPPQTSPAQTPAAQTPPPNPPH